jgi:2'-hydroxyisoflavone reductase
VDVLVIGGSVFVGRAVVAAARGAGARVTVFNRGHSGPAPEGVEQIVGDRTSAADLRQLGGRRFDLVVDTCGYVPADVARAAELLADACAHYCFISSINAYPGWPEDVDHRARGVWNGDPDATRADVPADVGEAGAYGWLKVGCEQAVERAFGQQRHTVLRAGAIVGPQDRAVGRLPWWIDRIARGGAVLVPGRPYRPMALIDARDLADFACSGAAGTFDVPGPAGRDTWADLLDACRTATGSDARAEWVDDEWLLAQDVAPWTELPLWSPPSAGPGAFTPDGAAAAAAGLRWRPLAETVTDTWNWMQQLPEPWQPTPATPGLEPAKENELLAEWHSR